MPRCLIGLGSNLGDRTALLADAIDRLAAHPHIENVVRSSWHATKPIGGPSGQGDYVNAAVALDTSLSPEALIDWMHSVEQQLGRQRRERWAARMVDLDLLLYGDLTQQTSRLEIPHPRMAVRRFVLEPAAEIAAEMVHPASGWTIRRLLDHLNTAFPYVAIAGLPNSDATELAERVAGATGFRWLRDEVSLASEFGENSLDHALQQLARRAAQLDRRTWSEQPVGVVSDFWLGQSVAFAEDWNDPAARARLRERYEQLRTGALPPKLLVLLAAGQRSAAASPSGESPPTIPPTSLAALERQRQLQDNLANAAGRDAECPVFPLAAGDAHRAADEVVAAIQAMQ